MVPVVVTIERVKKLLHVSYPAGSRAVVCCRRVCCLLVQGVLCVTGRPLQLGSLLRGYI
jgi:hypothetical protein